MDCLYTFIYKNMKNYINREELYQLYVIEKQSIKTISQIFNCSKNKISNAIKEYNIPIRTNIEVRELIKLRTKNTMINKYGVEYPYQIPEVRDKMIYKVHQTYSTGEPQEKLKYAWSTGDIQERSNTTRHKNNSFGKSSDEESIYKLLVEKFGQENICRQHQTSLYSYPCDFYIKSLDLYIEYQGSWVHGKEPYSKNKSDHIDMVNKWRNKNTEYFLYAIKIWTERDPLKRQIAKDNNLNFMEFFSMNQFYNWYNIVSV